MSKIYIISYINKKTNKSGVSLIKLSNNTVNGYNSAISTMQRDMPDKELEILNVDWTHEFADDDTKIVYDFESLKG